MNTKYLISALSVFFFACCFSLSVTAQEGSGKGQDKTPDRGINDGKRDPQPKEKQCHRVCDRNLNCHMVCD